MATQLPVTGERVIPGAYLRSRSAFLIYLFHIATYRFALPYVANRQVLDFGCGTGYGTALLAGQAATAVGVDLSADAVSYAREHYPRANLDFRTIGRIEREPLPFDDGQFDTVVSFQVIEHLVDTDAYLREIARVLRPGGIFLVATPDRSTRLLPKQRPWNRFHVREFSAAQLLRVLANRFADIELLTMSGIPRVLEPELRRTRLLRWTTLPFTFPLAPEPWRQWGLELLHRLHNRPASGTEQFAANDFGFGEKDLCIGSGAKPSVNLVAVARRP